MNKEQAYDTKIQPLMTQIVAICKEHGIAMLASYAIPTPEDDGLRCTTHLPDGEGTFDNACQEAFYMVHSGGVKSPPPAMLTTRHAGGSKTFTAVLG